MTQVDSNSGTHLTPDDVAAFLDHTLSAERRLTVEAHIADCDPCREEIVAISRTVSGSGRRIRRRAVGSGLAAAAVIAFAVLRANSPELASERGATLRGEFDALQTEGVEKIEVVRPRDEDSLSSVDLRFVWRRAEGDASYSFTLTDGYGDVLWRGQTRDSVISISSEVLLDSGSPYFWYVDALLEEGVSATTGVHEFVVK